MEALGSLWMKLQIVVSVVLDLELQSTFLKLELNPYCGLERVAGFQV